MSGVASGGLRYIVNAPSFNPDSGGTIFMHELVHTLNEQGEDAYLWPMAPISRQGTRARIRTMFRPVPYTLNPALNTPIATRQNLKAKNTAVIYPEIVPGNPLKVKNVIRWLLYKPGDQHPYRFTENEMFFRVFEKADLPKLTGGAPDLFLYKINRSYRNEHHPARQGVCYTVRKGHRKPRIAETEDPAAINIEGLTHEEINDVFNRCDVFYSYDEATMYSQFAALCGCLSVVIPGEHLNRKEWSRENELGQYGVAYGLEPSELAHARNTQSQLLELLRTKEKAGLDTVQQFIELTQQRFLPG